MCHQMNPMVRLPLVVMSDVAEDPEGARRLKPRASIGAGDDECFARKQAEAFWCPAIGPNWVSGIFMALSARAARHAVRVPV